MKNKYFLYALFAFISTLINIATQKFVEFFILLSGFNFFKTIIYKNITVSLLLKMFVATIIAFVFKFLVDKILIFGNRDKAVSENVRQILFYGFFAVFTTLIFWGTELLFKLFFSFRYSEYAGAVIGLCIGYTIKYILDKKFVFNINK